MRKGVQNQGGGLGALLATERKGNERIEDITCLFSNVTGLASEAALHGFRNNLSQPRIIQVSENVSFADRFYSWPRNELTGTDLYPVRKRAGSGFATGTLYVGRLQQLSTRRSLAWRLGSKPGTMEDGCSGGLSRGLLG